MGEAEVVATLNGSKFRTEVRELGQGSGQGSLGALGKDGERAGEQVGAGLEKGAKSKLSGFKSALGSFGVPEGLLSPKALGIGALVGVGAAAVDLGMKAQSASAMIATSAGITTKAAQSITSAMLDTAGASEFSGIEQAKAFASVAGQLKATEGQALSTKDAMLVMANASDLASAKQIDLGTATTTVAGIMQAFQLSAKNSKTAVDVLFNASNATGQSVDTLAASFEKLHSKLGAASPPLGDLAGLMVNFTKSGITGRGAISAMNLAVSGLATAAEGSTKAGKLSAATLKEYGLSATDAHGRLTPMQDIVAKLAPVFSKMTQTQQLATAATIFGTGAAKSMTAVIDKGAKSFIETEKAVNKQGSAQEAAGIQAQTLGVQFKTVMAAVEDLGAKLGTILVPIIEKLMKVIVPVLGIFIKIVKAIMDNKVAMIAIGSILVAVAAYFVAMGVAAAAAWVAATWPILAFLAAIAAVVAAVYEIINHWKVISHFFVNLWHDVTEIFMGFIHWLESNWKIIVEIIIGPIAIIIFHWNQIVKFFEGIWNTVRHGVAHVIDDIVGFFTRLPGRVISWIKHFAPDVLHAFTSWIPGQGVLGNLFGAGESILGLNSPKPLPDFYKNMTPAQKKAFNNSPFGTIPTSSTSNNQTHIHVNGSNMDAAQLAAELAWLTKTGQLAGSH